MALINCPECNKEVSSNAATCPSCGLIINQEVYRSAMPSTPNLKKVKIVPIIIAAVVVLGAVGSFVGMRMYRTAKEEAIAQAIILKDQQAFDAAQAAYARLCKAADMTISVMDSVYGTWSFGIYDADDFSTTNVISNLSKKVSLSESELKDGLESLAITSGIGENSLLYLMTSKDKDTSNWMYCLLVVNEAYVVNGVFDEIQLDIESANASLKTMTIEYDDYKHYPALKEFYSKVSSYFEFAADPSGSFQQLGNTKRDFEDTIRTLRSDLSFIFES